MKLRYLAALLLLLTLSALSRAQVSAPITQGNIAASSTNCTAAFSCVWQSVLPSNAATTTVNLSGSFSATLLVEESNNGGQTWTTAATLSSTGTTTYSTNGFTDIRVRCSAFTSGPVVVTISTGLNTGLQGPPGPAGSGGGITQVSSLPGTCSPGSQFMLPNKVVATCGPSANTYSFQGDPTPNYATSSGVKADGKAAFGNTATITIASGNATITVSTGPFAASDVGKDIFYSNGCCGVQSSYNGISLGTPTTIATFISATQVTVTVAPSGNCNTSACIVLWGTNDDTAWTAAEAAWSSSGSGRCQSMIVPNGMSFIKQPHLNQPGNSCNLGAEPELDFTANVRGYGPGSSILVAEGTAFNYAGCTFGGGSNGCFQSYTEATGEDYAIWGGGVGNTGNNAKFIFNPGAGSKFVNISFIAMGGSDTSLIGWNLTAAWSGLGVICDGGGSTCASVNTGASSEAICYDCFWGDTNKVNLTYAAGNYVDFNTFYGTSGAAGMIDMTSATGASYRGYNTFLFTGPQTSNFCALQMGSGANNKVYFIGANWQDTSTQAFAVCLGGATQIFSAAGGSIIAGTVTGSAINRAAGTVFLSDDTILTQQNTTISPTCTFSTGGGTTPSCAAQAGSLNERGVIIATTGTGSPGSSGTITLTFAGTFAGPTGAAPACTFTADNSGTAWNNGAVMEVSTQSTTAPVMAWTNYNFSTPGLVALTVSSPYRIDYLCHAR